MTLVAERGHESGRYLQGCKQPTRHPVRLKPRVAAYGLCYLVSQVGHLRSESTASVGARTAETPGLIDVPDESFEGSRVPRHQGPQQNPEEHVFRESIGFGRQVYQVWRPDWPAVQGDAGRDVPGRFAQAGEGQEGVEEDAVALRRPSVSGLSRKTQPSIAPGPGFLGESLEL